MPKHQSRKQGGKEGVGVGGLSIVEGREKEVKVEFEIYSLVFFCSLSPSTS